MLRLQEGRWDDADVVIDVVKGLHKCYEAHIDSGVPWVGMYDRVYVDEVQDLTQAEIGVLYLIAGFNGDALFFAGDTAQSIAYGVEFRFEEVRSCVYHLTKGKQKLDRVERLSRNFRSHDGILRVANKVLDVLFEAFPNMTDVMHADTGLAVGPRPGLMSGAMVGCLFACLCAVFFKNKF